MSYISLIRLNNFRNLATQDLVLSDLTNIFVGPNGAGKTNIIESLSLLAPGRGLKKESLNRITNFQSQEPWTVFVKYKEKNMPSTKIAVTYDDSTNGSNLKKILINGNKEKKIYETNYIPNFIWFTSEIERLFNGSPSLRRNFIDRITYSFNKKILFDINKYNKLIKERSQIIQLSKFDEIWLNKVEDSLATLGISIMNQRNKTLNILNNAFNNDLAEIRINGCNINIVGDIDKINLNNNPEKTKEIYLDLLKEARKEDSFRGGCKIGPHKSDIEVLYLKNNLLANYCSTGQQKEIILNILLCQSFCLISELNNQPILLLDEICSHLDEQTRSVLLYLVEWLKIQVLMTGNDRKLFSFLTKKAKFFDVNDGIVTSD